MTMRQTSEKKSASDFWRIWCEESILKYLVTEARCLSGQNLPRHTNHEDK